MLYAEESRGFWRGQSVTCGSLIAHFTGKIFCGAHIV